MKRRKHRNHQAELPGATEAFNLAPPQAVDDPWRLEREAQARAQALEAQAQAQAPLGWDSIAPGPISAPGQAQEIPRQVREWNPDND